MLKEINARPVVMPEPVLIVGTFDENGVPDAMNVAWGGQCGPREIALNIGSTHKTTENMRRQGAFTLHIGDVDRVALSDFFGIASGKKIDKFTSADVAYTKGKVVNAPIIEDFMLAMECRIVSMTDIGGGAVRVVGEVVRTVADDTIINSDGKVDYRRLRPIVFDSETNEYLSLGESVGKAFSIGRSITDF